MSEHFPALPLFAPPPAPADLRERPRAVHRRVAAKHAGEIAQLVPLIREMGRRAGANGVIPGEVRMEALSRGLLSAHLTGRELGWLPAAMLAAGGVATDRRRPSPVPSSNGHPHVIYVFTAEEMAA